jgi:beta-N-acetylglucosaminidase/uncharacterized protein YraI
MKNIGKVILLSACLLLGGVTVPFTPIGAQNVEAASVVKIGKTTYHTTANLNMRTGASTKYKTIKTIPKGKAVIATQRKGSWYKVSYTYKSKWKNVTKTGWVSGSYLKKSTPAPKTVKFSKTAYQTTVNLKMHTGAGTGYKTLLTIPKKKVVTSSEKKGSWNKVWYTYKSKGKNVTKTGWISNRYLKEYYQYIKFTGTHYFTKKTAYFYTSPDRKKKAYTHFVSNTGFYSNEKAINSLGQTWYRVSYKGKTLYVYSGDVIRYTSKNFLKTGFKAKKDTYIYSSYGLGYSKFKIKKGTVLSSTYSLHDWYKVSYQGKSGYIRASDFTRYTPIRTVTETPISGKTYITIRNINLKKYADSSSGTLLVVPNEKMVRPITKTSNGWYKFSYSGKTGYASGTDLKEVIKGETFSRDSYQFLDLRIQSPVTATQINNYIANYIKLNDKKSILLGKGQAFIKAGNKYGVNSLYLAAHAIHESGYGTSNISFGKRNLFGFGAYDSNPFISAYLFSTVDQSIDYLAREIKATYLNPLSWKYNGAYLGYTTKDLNNKRVDAYSGGMNFYYASDSNWGYAIASHMQRILPYNKNYYINKKANLTMFSRPAVPSGSDKFPTGIQAVAKKDLPLYSEKGNKTKVAAKIKEASKFYLLEKTNDFWIKVMVDNQTYWTDAIHFVEYNDYLSVLNLGRVTADGLNVRDNASTDGKIIAVLGQNQYVQLMLDKKGKRITNSSKTWNKVKLSDGKIGWVYSPYISIELK